MDFLGNEFNLNKINILNISSAHHKQFSATIADDLVPAIKKDQLPTVVGVAVKRSLRAARDDYELLQKFKQESSDTFGRDNDGDSNNNNCKNEDEMTDFQNICKVLKELSEQNPNIIEQHNDNEQNTSQIVCNFDATTNTVTMKDDICSKLKKITGYHVEDNRTTRILLDGQQQKKKVMETTSGGSDLTKEITYLTVHDEKNVVVDAGNKKCDTSVLVRNYNSIKQQHVDNTQQPLESINEEESESLLVDLIDLSTPVTTRTHRRVHFADESSKLSVDSLLIDGYADDTTDVVGCLTSTTTSTLPLPSVLECNDNDCALASTTHTLPPKALLAVEHVNKGCAWPNESTHTLVQQLEKHKNQQQSFPSSINNEKHVQDNVSSCEKLLNNNFRTDISCSWQVEENSKNSTQNVHEKFEENYATKWNNAKISATGDENFVNCEPRVPSPEQFKEKLLDKRKIYYFPHTATTTTPPTTRKNTKVTAADVVVGCGDSGSGRHDVDDDENHVKNLYGGRHDNDREKLLSKRKFSKESPITSRTPSPCSADAQQPFFKPSKISVQVTVHAHVNVDDLIQPKHSCQSFLSETKSEKSSKNISSIVCDSPQAGADKCEKQEKSIKQEQSEQSSYTPDKESWHQDTTNKVDLSFLTKGTSQYFHPPVFVESSILADTAGSFEASNRLKRLEARFKGLAYTKKLLHSDDNDEYCDANKNTDDTVDDRSCADDGDDKKSIALLSQQSTKCNLSSLRKFLFDNEPKVVANNEIELNNTSTSIKNNNTSALYVNGEVKSSNFYYKSLETIEKNEQLLSAIKLESVNDKNNNNLLKSRNQNVTPEVESNVDSEEVCQIIAKSEIVPVLVKEETVDYGSILAGDVYTNCEFDVRQLRQYAPGYGRVFECYDELDEDLSSNTNLVSESVNLISDSSSDDNDSCECSIEAVPLYFQTNTLLPGLNQSLSNSSDNNNKMRETSSASGTLRGLLKKPNRPPPVRKNRVVFDETRNEFFDADYIILIREDCPYDEEDEEPCTCGEHELVRICCDEGCNCGYTAADDGRTPPSPKFAPPIEFVDQATLSPPEGYKDGGNAALLDNALGGALGGHVFGAQHIQQLQVIQRLQQQRAAMVAAAQRTPTQTSPQQTATPVSATLPPNLSNVCTECAECAECAAKQLLDEECNSQCSEEVSPMDMPHAIAIVQKPSPERRITQKEIVAGEERPKFLTNKQQEAQGGMEKIRSSKNKAHKEKNNKNQRLVVETITTTTVTEHRIVHETIDAVTSADDRLLKQQQPTVVPTTTAQSLSNNVPHLATSATNSLLINRNKSSINNQNLSNNNNNNNNISNNMQQQQQQQHHNNNLIINNNLINNNNNNSVNDKQKLSDVSLTTSTSSLFSTSSSKSLSTSAAITGILKGGKLWTKTEQATCDDSTNTTSDEETSSKRSVRFTEELSAERGGCDGGEVSADEKLHQPIDYVSHTLKRHHTSLFHNALRPNSAVRQLFPSHMHTTSTAPLTHEALRALEEAKKAGLLMTTAAGTTQSTATTTSTNTSPTSGETSAGTVAAVGAGMANNNANCLAIKNNNDAETDTIKRTIERNALRRSLIKYEPKKKPPPRDATSLEERIRQLTCDIDDPVPGSNDQTNGTHSQTESNEFGEMERRDSPAGEENPQQPKYTHDKSFSPSSSASSSSSGSTGSTYRKITDLFNKDRRQERIPEADENPIVIIPQDCRCPAGPDIGMGVQIQGGHTQVHQPPHAVRQNDSRRQFLSTLAPLTACVAGQRDDLSYYTLAHPGDRTSVASSQATEYSLGDIDAVLHHHQEHEESKKVAPDVIAGTPGQEPDELVAFAQQEAPRTERLKKRYSGEQPLSAPQSGNGSDDDEQNDYGFNRRPSVRGIKPRFGSTNEILQQMQAQLAQPTALQQKPLQVQTQQQTTTQTQIVHSQTLPRQNSTGSVVAAKQQITAHHQQTASWSYYPEVQQKPPQHGSGQVVDTQYYQLPPHSRHSFHGHEAVYQNCHTVSMQHHVPQQVQHQHMQQQQHPQQAQQHNAQQYAYARSPTRRPESPPPLRNYHQTMVLIPYNADPYQQYDPENPYPRAPNVVEYQQVTQQTIRVPVGYPLPGMAVHLVAGRGVAQAPPHYATLPRLQGPPKNYAYATMDKGSVKFSERGAPEGAASSAPQNDCNNYKLMSPTGAMPTPQMGVPMQQQQQQPQQQTVMSSPPQQQPQQQQQQQQQGAVFYAMNV